MAITLERATFQTSRLLEFFTVNELSMQIGHGRELWPTALTKELIDNALDACETSGAAPEIVVTVGDDFVSVQDSGPGLPTSTLERSLDYNIRVSDKLHYVSPSRGQLGNALKCVWAAPFVADGEHGRVEVTTGGVVHEIDVTVDRIAQQPNLTHTTRTDGLVKNGTLVKMCWPGIACYLRKNGVDIFYKSVKPIGELVRNYALFNPHAVFSYGDRTYPATSPDWRKWRPGDPTDPHWYDADQLRALIAAYVAGERNGDRARTVREFVAEFRGLSGTAKQKAICDGLDLSGAYLHDLVDGGDIDRELTAALLAAMQEGSRPATPAALGIIEGAHFVERLTAAGTFQADTIRYAKRTGMAGSLPFVIEAVFAQYKEGIVGTVVAGLNWTPTIRIPFADLSNWLSDVYVDSYDPVILIVHLACPHLEFTDRGKTTVALPDEIAGALQSAIKSVCKDWTDIKRRMRREERANERAMDAARRARLAQRYNIKEAAWDVMEQAYLKASAGGKLPANARQIMYAARPLVLELTGGKCWKNSSYFTQHLLPDYVDAHPAETAEWDVVYDARGHLHEPHTGTEIGLGTLDVRDYIRDWRDRPGGLDLGWLFFGLDVKTKGPANRYRYALFLEKEGFNELLAHVRLAERYDLAIMSTKGLPVTAARELAEALTRQGVTILVLRDFDKAGFAISHTLQADTRRYQFDVTPDVIDLGLRLDDVQAMDLQSERVEYRQEADPRENLIECGATPDECAFLVQRRIYGRKRWAGQRVELNAMTSDQFVDWLTGKLDALGVQKVVPEEDILIAAYKKAKLMAAVQKEIDRVTKEFDAGGLDIPPDLRAQVASAVQDTDQPWDKALERLAHTPAKG